MIIRYYNRKIGGEYLRIGFKTTLEESLISDLKIEAVKNKVNVNDILEELITKFLKGKIELDVADKKWQEAAYSRKEDRHFPTTAI